jgi:hypothetical protein
MAFDCCAASRVQERLNLKTHLALTGGRDVRALVFWDAVSFVGKRV